MARLLQAARTLNRSVDTKCLYETLVNTCVSRDAEIY